MTAEELKTLHEEYRRAVEASRHPESEEEAEKASTAMLDLRHKLDAALIEDKAEREDEQRAEAVEARANAAKLVASVEPAPAASAFPVDEIRAVARGERHALTTRQEYRTAITNEQATTYAGYTVPETWASNVVNFQIASSGVLKAGPMILTTAAGNIINMPKLVTDATSTATAEGDAASVSNVVFGQSSLGAYRFDGFFTVSDELLADTSVPMESLLGEYAGRSLAALINPYFADPDVGVGTTTIAAVQLGATTGKTSALSTTTNLDDWKELMYSVLPQYRMSGRAAWVANSAETLAMALRRDDTGNYIWQPSNMASEPDRLWGYPWYEDAYCDTTASANEPGMFGDFKAAYVVRYGYGGMDFSASKEFAFTSYSTTFRWAVWVDAIVVDTLAVKTLLMT